jgi:hypothetical protein
MEYQNRPHWPWRILRSIKMIVVWTKITMMELLDLWHYRGIHIYEKILPTMERKAVVTFDFWKGEKQKILKKISPYMVWRDGKKWKYTLEEVAELKPTLWYYHHHQLLWNSPTQSGEKEWELEKNSRFVKKIIFSWFWN